MQKQLIHGVPYFTDKSNTVFLWDAESSPPFAIGTFNPIAKTVSYNDNIKETLASKLTAWRQAQEARPRKPTEAKSSKRRGAGEEESASTNDAEDDA